MQKKSMESDISTEISSVKDMPANEKVQTFDINVAAYNPSDAYLNIKEDLTEKVIGYIEKEVRSSFEYRGYISYLKNELDLTKCSLLPGIDCSNGAASLEFHHYPMNLYEICDTVGKEMIDKLGEGESVSCFDISNQVMKEHYEGNIGLVPLTKTLHDMAHNNSIIVPISKVNGNYKAFIKKYNSYIDDDIKDRIHEAEFNSESDDSKLYNTTKLEKIISDYSITYNKGE